MGLLWEIVQSGFIYNERVKSQSIEERVAALEEHLQRTQDTLIELVKQLEKIHGEDLDGDGRIG